VDGGAATMIVPGTLLIDGSSRVKPSISTPDLPVAQAIAGVGGRDEEANQPFGSSLWAVYRIGGTQNDRYEQNGGDRLGESRYRQWGADRFVLPILATLEQDAQISMILRFSL
jgi:hypothetical protein